MGDTNETNTKVLSGELFFRYGSTTNAYTKNNYIRDMVPFLTHLYIYIYIIMKFGY